MSMMEKSRKGILVSSGLGVLLIVALWMSYDAGTQRRLRKHKEHHHSDQEVARHLFRVASGLDSMVLGEPQILGQLKDSYDQARGDNAVNSILDRLFHRRENAALDFLAENRIAIVAVDLDRAGRVVRVGAIDEHAAVGNAQLDLDVHQHGIEQVSIDHENVARDDGETAEWLLFEHDGGRAQFALLTLHLAAKDAAANHHIVRGLERNGGRADAQAG